jgi:hypothetical protein
MIASTSTEPQADNVDFEVWYSSKKVGTARRTAEGYIIVKLDADVQVKSSFILHPVRTPTVGTPVY